MRMRRFTVGLLLSTVVGVSASGALLADNEPEARPFVFIGRAGRLWRRLPGWSEDRHVGVAGGHGRAG